MDFSIQLIEVVLAAILLLGVVEHWQLEWGHGNIAWVKVIPIFEIRLN